MNLGKQATPEGQGSSLFASRHSIADAIEKMLRDEGAKVVRGVGDGKPYAVLLIETPKGERHHLRIIDVAGNEHQRFTDA